MMLRSGRTLSFAVLFMLLGVALALGTAQIISAQSSTVINACVDNTGNIRILNSGGRCRNNETAIQWNVAGPMGPQGLPGANGAPGSQGLPGVQGANGLNCWDLNGNSTFDTATEDRNGDGVSSAADCQGLAGSGGTILGFYRRYSESVNIPPGTSQQAVAQCDTGDLVTGGGYMGAPDFMTIYGNGPLQSENGWTIYAKNGWAYDEQIMAYAVCADLTP